MKSVKYSIIRDKNNERLWMMNSIGKWTRKTPSTWGQDIAPTATSAEISRMAADAVQ